MFESFFNKSQEIHAIANFKGQFEKVNGMFCDVLGYTEEELLSQPFLNFVHPDDIEKTLKETEKLQSDETNVSLTFNNRYRKKDGSYVRFYWYGYSDLKDELIYCTVRLSLGNIEFKGSSIWESYVKGIKEIVSVINEEGLMLFVNRVAEDYRGTKTIDDFLGKTTEEVWGPKISEQIIRRIKFTKDTGKSYIYTLELPDGKEFLSQYIPYYEDETFIGAIVKSQSLDSEFNQGIDALAFEKLEEKLAEKNKLLLQRNTDLQHFAHAAAHNLKSPLNNAIGLFQMAKDLGGFKENIDLIETAFESIEIAVERIQKLNAILHSNELSARVKKYIKVTEELSKIVDSVKKEMQIGEEISVDYSECKLDLIHFSGTHFETVFYNLISNSIKYRSEDKPLELKLQSGVTDESAPFISVKDNGIGFDAEKLGRKIFNIYERLNHTQEGDGVGMFLVKQIVDNYASHITVESEVGKGSSFTIYFKNENLPSS